jgi:hypothetical protein
MVVCLFNGFKSIIYERKYFIIIIIIEGYFFISRTNKLRSLYIFFIKCLNV